MSEEFVHLSYIHHNFVKLNGVYQTGGWRIPMEVLQTYFHYSKAAYQVW